MKKIVIWDDTTKELGTTITLPESYLGDINYYNLQNIPLIKSDTEPSNNDVLWFDITSNELKYYNNDKIMWIPIISNSSTSTIDINSLEVFSFFVSML